MELKDRVEGLLADHRIYHDDVQIAHFIVAPPERTAYGAYRQCLRELYRRYRGLKELYIQRARARLRNARSQRRAWLPWGRQERRLALHEGVLGLEDLERNIEDTAREFRAFLQHAEALKKRVGELTPERRRELELKQWEHELGTRARFDMVLNRALARGTAEAICALPESSVDRILRQEGLENLPALPRSCEDATVPMKVDRPLLSTAALDVER